MEGGNDLTVPLEHLTLGHDSYSSGSYSGISESHSSSHSPNPDHDTELSSGYVNDYSELGSLTKAFGVVGVAKDGQIQNGRIQNGRIQNGRIQDGRPCTSSPKDICLTTTTMENTNSGESSDYTVVYPMLPELDRCPWNEQDVLHVLREGRPKHLSSHITVEMLQHACHLLRRPLTRVATEIRRLCVTLRRCGKTEVQNACGIILSRSLADSCQQACAKAVALYSMSAESLKKSKSSRCGLKFSVGKFHRWMVDMKLATYVHEYAAIFLAAAMENLLEEMVLRALADQKLGKHKHSNQWVTGGIYDEYDVRICISLPSGSIILRCWLVFG